MARKGLNVLSESELTRLEDCSVENDGLADAWDRDNVVIVTLAYIEPPSNPLFILEVMPRVFKRPNSWYEFKSVHKYTLQILGAGEEIQIFKQEASAFWIPYETYRAPRQELKNRLKEVFQELQQKYGTVCLVSQRLRETLLGLDKLGFSIPKNVVTVDLVKVLEYQTMDGLSKMDLQYLENKIDIRGRRHELKASMENGSWTVVSPSRLLEIVGPRAEEHRGTFDKIRREHVNLKRVAGRLSSKDVKAMKIMARREAKGGPPGVEND